MHYVPEFDVDCVFSRYVDAYCKPDYNQLLEDQPADYFARHYLEILKVLGIIIYRLFLHPLSRYPGPFMAKITGAYGGYHAWKGDIHLDMWRCHEKYGAVVRYGPGELIFNTATSLQDIYANRKNVQKSANYAAMVHRAPNTFTLIDRKEHARHRSLLSYGFSESALREHENSIRRFIGTFCEIIQTKLEDASNQGETGTLWDMSKWMGYLAFDVMTTFVFGRQYDLLGKQTYRYVPAAIEGSNVRVSVLMHFPLLAFRRIDRWIFYKSIVARNYFLYFVSKLLKDTMKAQNVSEKPDHSVFSLLCGAKEVKRDYKFTPEEIAGESVNLIVAGSDTTATVMAGLFFYLARNPSVLSKVTKELRTAFSSADEIRNGPTMNSCTYLRACIDETLRMSPPVGEALFREVLTGGAVIDGHQIPAGCQVGTPIYAIHHNPQYYSDPFTFNPERWLLGGTNTQEMIDAAHSAFNPFSIGPRGCIGKSFAYLEAKLTIGTLLWQFDLETSAGPAASSPKDPSSEYQLKAHITATKTGPVVKFRLRDTTKGHA